MVVRVRPHAFFERKGDDIYTVVPVTFSEAYLGAEVEIGTIHGPVRAKIPAGTQSGQRFRLRGKGVRNVRTGVHGDHYYTVQVTVPRVVSPAGREAARRVGELYVGAGDPRAGPAQIARLTATQRLRSKRGGERSRPAPVCISRRVESAREVLHQRDRLVHRQPILDRERRERGLHPFSVAVTYSSVVPTTR